MSEERSDFTGLINLADEALGARTIAASDEFFAEKENLLRPGRGRFEPDAYTERGKWMDGWESRRKRGPGHDWCIVELGERGAVRVLDIDTNHFLGNHPPYASVDGLRGERGAKPSALEDATWTEIMPASPLRPGSQNLFAVGATEAWTHLRLNIFPDGGVARLRALRRRRSRLERDGCRPRTSSPTELDRRRRGRPRLPCAAAAWRLRAPTCSSGR